ncbi:hypothetical protein [Streptomyces recifensis]|uniref:hypothetical protein n=1 Tax=Streptomyces recifensis TaxID=67355 RepID=UPI000A3D583E|nr:hypothetical protein [Streptomyces recifensis]
MSISESPRRSAARAHLSQLIDMFGTDGCLRISTHSVYDTSSLAPDIASKSDEPGNDEQT